MEILDKPITVKPSRLKSVVWNDFDRIRSGETFVAVCRHCKKILSGSSSSGTSHLRNHLIRCRRRSNHDIVQFITAREKKKEGSRSHLNVSSAPQQKRDEILQLVDAQYEHDHPKGEHINYGNVFFDQKRSEVDLARMVILHGYPLTMVEHIGFRMFVRRLQPSFELVTSEKIEAGCMEIYKKEKQKVYEILDKLPGKIGLTFDTWTASEDAKYLCLTAHYIDETWQLQKKVLNFVPNNPSHTEDLVSEVIMTCLMDWDIDRKLFSITFDSGSTTDNIAFRIRERLFQNRFLLCNGQLFDVRCAANVLKLMVLDVLEASGEIMHKIRGSIQYIKSSQNVHHCFNELAQQVEVDCQKYLCLDNPFHWNSTYFMLEAALEYRNAFLLLLERDPLYTSCPSNVEWERASSLTSYLKLFFEVTNAFIWNKCPTANMYFPEICNLHLQLIEWCTSADEYISSLASKIKSKFDDFWKKSGLCLAVAAVLDPRYKMKLIEYYYPQIYGSEAPHQIDFVSGTIKVLYNEHAICSPLASLDEGLTCEVSSSGEANVGYVHSSANDSRDRLTGFDKYLHETSQSLGIKSDLEKYLEEPLFPRNADFNILEWWCVHTPRYPILSMMARSILGVPMSKMSLESAFHIGDRVLDHHWSSHGPDTLQALMCAKDWMHNELVDSKSFVSDLTLTGCLDTN